MNESDENQSRRTDTMMPLEQQRFGSPESARSTPPESARSTPPESARSTPPESARFTSPDMARAHSVMMQIRDRIRQDVMGRDDVIELVLVALFAGGHVLLEDYPGSGKTTLAKALGESIKIDASRTDLSDFRRLQFTPDLLPSDITGVMIFDPKSNQFHFRRGPLFAHVVLVDEINRTSPKVQAALLESMAESQVTVDNVSHQLDELFFVIATQNPLDSVGTYPLPVAQLDRFLFKIPMVHVSRSAELEVLEQWGQPRQIQTTDQVHRNDVITARQWIRSHITVTSSIHECLVDTARRIREDARVAQGVSTRSLVQAIPALQTLAVLRGRDYILPDDIQHLSGPLFSHRMTMVPGGGDPDIVVRDALQAPLDILVRSSLRR